MHEIKLIDQTLFLSFYILSLRELSVLKVVFTLQTIKKQYTSAAHCWRSAQLEATAVTSATALLALTPTLSVNRKDTSEN